MYLRGNEELPNDLSVRIIFQDGSEVVYKIPIIKVQKYSKEEMFNKKLLFFIPYYILRFEKELKNIEQSEEHLQDVAVDYQEIYEYLQSLQEQQVINKDYLNTLITLTNKLVDVVAKPAQNLRRKVSNVGGKVLYMEWERIRDEAIEQGLAEGRTEGRAETIATFVEDYLEEGFSKEKIMDKLIKKFELTQEQAEGFFS